jgi:hypothetical protein
MRAIDGFNTGAISGTYAPSSPGVVVSGGVHTSGVALQGGQYGFEVIGTVSAGGSVQLERIGIDSSATVVPVGSAVSSGATPNYQNITVPGGGYRVAVTSATVTVGCTRIPTE